MLFQKFGSTLVAHTPAKLNLFLEILGKRGDGYHDLETVMVSVNLYDTLSFTEGLDDGVSLTCLNAGQRFSSRAGAQDDIPAGPENLIVRAAMLLRNYAGVQRGAAIHVWKRIPAAAGLAGGSSDAAATLAALNRLWQLQLADEELGQLAARLGSDISFFLCRSGGAVCRGRGEQIEPLRLPLSLHFVIARPESGLSTALVYRHCRPAPNPRTAAKLTQLLQQGRIRQAAHELHNQLQPPAEELNEDVLRLKALFDRQPVLGHMMSGSGTAYFGMCANRHAARCVASRLKAAGIGRVHVVQSRQ